MLVIKCDFCYNEITGEGVICKFKRSIFQLLRLIPTLIISRGHALRMNKMYKKYNMCFSCYDRLHELMFRDPNRIEELRQQLTMLRRQDEEAYLPRQGPGQIITATDIVRANRRPIHIGIPEVTEREEE